jgi:hypothetical protein
MVYFAFPLLVFVTIYLDTIYESTIYMEEGKRGSCHRREDRLPVRFAEGGERSTVLSDIM